MMIVKTKNMYETAYYECTEEEESRTKRRNSQGYHLGEKDFKQRRKITRQEGKQRRDMAGTQKKSCKKELFHML